MKHLFLAPAVLLMLAAAPGMVTAAEDPRAIVSKMDVDYQDAVERNDWQAMDRILHPDFVLVIGDGTTYTRAQLIDNLGSTAVQVTDDDRAILDALSPPLSATLRYYDAAMAVDFKPNFGRW